MPRRRRLNSGLTNVQLLTRWTRPEYLALYEAAQQAGETMGAYLRLAARQRYERETNRPWLATILTNGEEIRP